MIAPDDTTVTYLAGRPRAPSGAAWGRAVESWRALRTDAGASYDKRVAIDASALAPRAAAARAAQIAAGRAPPSTRGPISELAYAGGAALV